MKAIESIIALIRGTNIQATAIWFKDKGLNCSFEQLFQSIDIPNLRLRNAVLSDYILYDRPRRKNLFIPFIFEKAAFNNCLYEDDVTQRVSMNFDFRQWVLSNKKTYLSACVLFYPGESKFRFNSFIPVPWLQERINERCKNFTNYTVGVHIRRTDNINSIRESPTELFIQRMKKEIESESDVRFYVASDSTEEKKKLTSIFGDRIITDWKPTSRSTPEGIEDALVELYSLSRTQKIFGSHRSSYSETAAEIGKISHEKIKSKL